MDRYAEHHRGVGQRRGDIVAVADIGQRAAAHVPPVFAEGQDIGQRLAGVLLVAERVDHVQRRRGRCQRRGLFLGVGPDDQGADPAFEVARDVLERFTHTFGKLGRQVQRVAAELTHRDLEGRAGPE